MLGQFVPEGREFHAQVFSGGTPVPVGLLQCVRQEIPLGLLYSIPEIALQALLALLGLSIILVMLFMIIYYRLPGLLASLSLIFYGALVLAIFKLVPVTLTLAGLGGFVLSIGMAVDANVLIF